MVALRKSLTELSFAAKQNLEKQQRKLDADTKHLPLSGQFSEEALLGDTFKALESQVFSLQLECLDHRLNQGILPELLFLDAGDAAATTGSDEVSLWRALEKKYTGIVHHLVADSLQDALRTSACELWEADLQEWRDTLDEFEQSLEASSSGWLGRRDSIRWSKAGVTVAAPGTARHGVGSTSPGISSSRRLLINLLKQPPSERSLDTLLEMVRHSCDAEDPDDDAELRYACAEIWDLVISLCGCRPKTEFGRGPSTSHLRDLTCNSLRSLEDACRRQLLHQVSVNQECSSGEELLECFCEVCALDGTVGFPCEAAHFWQLLYWCVRSGAIDALAALLRRLPETGGGFFQAREARLLAVLGSLAAQKLLGTSRSPATQKDCVWAPPPSAADVETGGADHRRETASLEELAELLHGPGSSELHAVVPLLIATVDPHYAPSSVNLREIMPNATAEDFLWFNLHLALQKSDIHLQPAIVKLQKKILQAGPSHFGCDDGDQRNLSFAKIALLALAPAAALDWVLHVRPALSVICVEWIIYLTQFGVLGSGDSLTNVMFAHLATIPCAYSAAQPAAAVLAQGGLAQTSPETAFQLCELLPWKERGTVISACLSSVAPSIFADRELEATLLGTVAADGSCRGALLYRVLTSKGWDVALSWRETMKEEARQVFANTENFPVFSQPTPSQLDVQTEARMLFGIYEKRVANGELGEFGVTFEMLRLAATVVDIYAAANCERWRDAWEIMNDPTCPLLPTPSLIARWRSTDLAPHLPALVEVAGRCLQTLASVGALSNDMAQSHAEVLLESRRVLQRSGVL